MFHTRSLSQKRILDATGSSTAPPWRVRPGAPWHPLWRHSLPKLEGPAPPIRAHGLSEGTYRSAPREVGLFITRKCGHSANFNCPMVITGLWS